MTLKHIFLSATVVTAGLFSLNAGFKGEPKDALDKKKYNVTISEIRENQPPKKGVADELEFKAGKGFFSQFLFDQKGFKWMKYEVTKDSTFTDEEQNEVHIIEANISSTNEEDETVLINCSVEDYDIKGEIKVTKKDKLKKRYEFSGKEKVAKKK